MDLLTKKNESKLAEKCSYPVTGLAYVKRVYTDLATFECSDDGVQLIDAVEGLAAKRWEQF